MLYVSFCTHSTCRTSILKIPGMPFQTPKNKEGDSAAPVTVEGLGARGPRILQCLILVEADAA